jgi:catechol 2,3-dioxygenase-like lactoylglutathione lyase family enzyme
MFAKFNAAINLAVRDVEVARAFYVDVLGLTLERQQGDFLLSFKSGETRLLVYKSEFAGTNKATALTWSVGDEFDGLVTGLKAKGVGFEEYPGITNAMVDGDIPVSDGGNHKIAWFKDPDGNILSVINR